MEIETWKNLMRVADVVDLVTTGNKKSLRIISTSWTYTNWVVDSGKIVELFRTEGSSVYMAHLRLL